jgi:two-component system, NarL family, sensor histidine kinase NreB
VTHSGSHKFEVRLWCALDELHLRVTDYGAGFEVASALKGPGLGLIRMEERLKLVKGIFSVDSQPKRGTTVHARAPLSVTSGLTRQAG